MFNISTDTIQNDTDDNISVTSNKFIQVNFEEILPFPIGGVHNEGIAIVCICRGMLPWMYKEGKYTMVDTLYSTEVDSTIVSSTTVV